MTDNKLNYHGKGFDLFGIMLGNFFLTLITFGIYYPWAKAKKLQYLYGQTSLGDSRFTFHGTGKELFIGFLKAFGLISLVMIVFMALSLMQMPILAMIVYLAGILAIVPGAIHGGMKYRMSRTSWRGIHFGYRGKIKEMFFMYLKGAGLTIITLGIYSSWFTIDLRKYIVGNIRFGNVQFKYIGQGFEYFLINLKGIILTILTIGIYGFWYARDLFKYWIDNLKIEQNGIEYSLTSDVSAGKIFKLVIINYLLIIFTLGIAYPWVVGRSLRFVMENIDIPEGFDVNSIIQTEDDYSDSTGEGIFDMLDLSILF